MLILRCDFAKALSDAGTDGNKGRLFRDFKENAGISDWLPEDLHEQLTAIARGEKDRAGTRLRLHRSTALSGTIIKESITQRL